ncbi:hypothetical protein AALA00_13315 [Lachnospiraceae bacterium 46-15]
MENGLEKLYKKEKAVRILDFYEKERYLCGYKKGLMELKNAVCKEPKDSHICD